MIYRRIIRRAAAGAGLPLQPGDARRIEALARTRYGTLDQLTRRDFEQEVRTFHLYCRGDFEQAARAVLDELAASYGLREEVGR